MRLVYLFFSLSLCVCVCLLVDDAVQSHMRLQAEMMIFHSFMCKEKRHMEKERRISALTQTLPRHACCRRRSAATTSTHAEAATYIDVYLRRGAVRDRK